MKEFVKPIALGSLLLPNNLFYASLSGCSNLAFRRICRSFHPGLMFCEMVKIEALVRREKKTLHLLEYDEEMHPIGAQIFGSNPKRAKEAAKMIEDLGFDVIDLNGGCPVKKVTRDGSGSALLKNLSLLEEILASIVEAVHIPVTLKIRVGWKEEEIVADKVVVFAEKIGAKAMIIHGRTAVQGYRGGANWDFIRECKEKANKILVFGNGDVFSAEDAERMFESTHCDGVVLARGILGKPWLAEDICRKAENKNPIERSPLEIRKELLRHFDMIFYSEKKKQNILFQMRHVGFWYLKNYPGAKALRIALNQAKSPEEAYKFVSGTSEQVHS